MKHMDNTIAGPVKRPMRRSLEALRKVKRFGFDMLDSGFFEGQKKFAIENPRPGDRDYHAWRAKFKLPDIMTTRIRHEIYPSPSRQTGKEAVTYGNLRTCHEREKLNRVAKRPRNSGPTRGMHSTRFSTRLSRRPFRNPRQDSSKLPIAVMSAVVAESIFVKVASASIAAKPNGRRRRSRASQGSRIPQRCWYGCDRLAHIVPTCAEHYSA